MDSLNILSSPKGSSTLQNLLVTEMRAELRISDINSDF